MFLYSSYYQKCFRTEYKMKLELLYVAKENPLYLKGVGIRIACFFKEIKNSNNLINDYYEENGIHLVCLYEGRVVIGTGRLNLKDNSGIISQMAVNFDYQKKGIGKLILLELIEKCKTQKIKTIEISAKETAIEFYKKNGFIVLGNKFPSIKTGITHQKMMKKL